jgi:hypothetical protein
MLCSGLCYFFNLVFTDRYITSVCALYIVGHLRPLVIVRLEAGVHMAVTVLTDV